MNLEANTRPSHLQSTASKGIRVTVMVKPSHNLLNSHAESLIFTVESFGIFQFKGRREQCRCCEMKLDKNLVLGKNWLTC